MAGAKRAPQRRFLRIYFDDLERDYPAVWFDPTCLSTFNRLLSLCEKAWPSDPELPVAVRQADMEILQKEGLVTLLAHDRFTMKGWKKERKARANAGKAGAEKLWRGRSKAPAIADANAMQTHKQTQSDSNARASSSSSKEASVASRAPEAYPVPGSDRDALDTYHELTRYRPWGSWSGEKLRAAIIDYTDVAVDAALRAVASEDADRNTLLDRALAKLARDAEKAKSSKVRPRLVQPILDEAAYAAARLEVRQPKASA